MSTIAPLAAPDSAPDSATTPHADASAEPSAPVAPSAEIDLALTPLRERMLTHPIYDAIEDEHSVRRFMEHHIYAVWDFMSLVKSLAGRLACADVPWTPTVHAAERRFINEIVLDEESDLDAEGRPLSHFEMYVAAMNQAGARTGPIDGFIESLRKGRPPAIAASEARVPAAAIPFMDATIALARGTDSEVAAGFAFGRELVIPPMFRAVVTRLESQNRERWAPFRFYLERHIETDGETHGPIARAIVDRVVGPSEERKRLALAAAERSLEARIGLWDAALAAIRADA